MKTKINNESIGQDAVTIISHGVMLEGKIKSNGNLRIDGTVNGNINANGNVTVGESGEVNGEVNANVIVVGGKIVGTITANEKVVLESKSNLKGDIITKILVVEEGAIFDGSSKMGVKENKFVASVPEQHKDENK